MYSITFLSIKISEVSNIENNDPLLPMTIQDKLEAEYMEVKFDSEENQMMVYCFFLTDTPVTIALLILILVSSEPIATDSLSMICFGVMFFHVGLYATGIHESIKNQKVLECLNC